jgi:hypothetical protein
MYRMALFGLYFSLMKCGAHRPPPWQNERRHEATVEPILIEQGYRDFTSRFIFSGAGRSTSPCG